MSDPVDWNARWHSGETPWDKGEAPPALVEELQRPESWFRNRRRVLVPGCGSGHDVRRLAARVPAVVGIDLSAKAIEVARSHPPAGGEDYRVDDFLRDDFHEPCDAIWEHTCLCAIDPARRPSYVASAARCLRPGGVLVGLFYLDPADPDDGPPFGSSREQIIAGFAADFELSEARVPERSYPSRQGREWWAVFVRLPASSAPPPHRGVADSRQSD